MSDKRSVATDALEVLGTIITNKEVGRDAIHLACLPVVAGERLFPGQDIGVTTDGTYEAFANKTDVNYYIGIVDPFLKTAVMPGEKFLLVIYPRKIASLRHVWSHPDVPDETTAVERERVIEKEVEVVKEVYVTRSGRKYDKSQAMDALVEIARDHWDVDVDVLFDAMDDGYMSDGGRFEGEGGSVNIPPEAWDLFEVVHGRRARSEGDDDISFSCSC